MVRVAVTATPLGNRAAFALAVLFRGMGLRREAGREGQGRFSSDSQRRCGVSALQHLSKDQPHRLKADFAKVGSGWILLKKSGDR